MKLMERVLCAQMVEEAGGKVTRMDGGDFSVFDRSVIVSNGAIHDKVSSNLVLYINFWITTHSKILACLWWNGFTYSLAICLLFPYCSSFFYKVSRPNLVTYLTQTPLFEWCALRCGSKNSHQKAIMSSKEISLCAENLFTILSSVVNIIGGIYVYQLKREFSLW